jgi:hypothetical protein
MRISTLQPCESALLDHLYSVVLEICVLVMLLVSLVVVHFVQQDNVSQSTEGNILSYDNR